MSDKSLKSKAIKIKGKDYVLVSYRVLFFNENYPNGSISTDYSFNDGTYIVKAIITPDVDNDKRVFYGTSQATVGDGMVNKTAALENAETSAVGRALAMLGIGVLDSIASADEMNKATGSAGAVRTGAKYATEKQIQWMRDTVRKYTEQDIETNEKVDKIIEEILTIKPENVPLFKVKDAVDRITSEFNKPTKTIINMPSGEVLDLDNLPY